MTQDDVPKAAAPSDTEFPLADVQPQGLNRIQSLRKNWIVWLLPSVCLLIAIGLVLAARGSQGPVITIRFERGHGVQPGAVLRYRGIDVGEVLRVELDEHLGGVVMSVRLEPESANLACEGSRFWIERPVVGLQRVRGLETVVGAKYVGVIPGDDPAKSLSEFTGIETPPTLDNQGVDELTITFRQGYGLSVGDVMKFRDMTVGEVTSVRLSSELDQVVVRVGLIDSAIPLARTGSHFWVERPRLSVTEIRGLETLLEGRYLAVIPGPAGGPSCHQFEGLEQPPTGELPEGGLEVVLSGTERYGLRRGQPLTYRGLRIGHVISIDLARDATAVAARVFVAPPYTNVIRSNSRFWSFSGIRVDAGLNGVHLEVDPLESLIAGGIAVATPDPLGTAVGTGHPFELAPEAPADWQSWKPIIPLFGSELPSAEGRPHAHRVAKRWTTRTFGITRRRQRFGWVIALDDGRLLGPNDLLQVESATAANSMLEITGKSVTLQKSAEPTTGPVGFLDVQFEIVETQTWPVAKLRVCERAEDCLLVGVAGARDILLTRQRLSEDSASWQIDARVPIDPDWHGIPVVAVSDGKVIGVLLVRDGAPRVGLLPPGSAAN